MSDFEASSLAQHFNNKSVNYPISTKTHLLQQNSSSVPKIALFKIENTLNSVYGVTYLEFKLTKNYQLSFIQKLIKELKFVI